MEVNEIIESIFSWWPVGVAVASAVAAVTPTPKDDQVLGKVYKVIDLIALNIGKAKQTGTRT